MPLYFPKKKKKKKIDRGEWSSNSFLGIECADLFGSAMLHVQLLGAS